MRVTRTFDVLVIEEDANTSRLLGWALVAFGAAFTAVGWRTAQPVIVIAAMVLFGFGVHSVLFATVKTHRFDRHRRVIVVESKHRTGTAMRELPFDTIKDVIVERGRQSYYLYYVTTQGERIRLADSYDGDKEGTLASFHAAREYLGLPVTDVA